MPSLFRGLSAAVWRERFEAAGWPKEAADHMALWLTIGAKDPPPEWQEILSKVKGGAQ
ncbi:hypothetical protein [Rhizobium ruizarguesonis]|uniref:hypothetical protein n=1 Tax=Rhizobium ruizarguesonis TaxID=2081791 RepID=UPI0013EE9284|nr:hypothetical protein [Rhizobium ruizarguesonis]